LVKGIVNFTKRMLNIGEDAIEPKTYLELIMSKVNQD